MKLSKQERIAALVIMAIIIIALGAFLLIKPAFEALGASTNTLESKEQELAAMEARRATKTQLRTDIEAAYSKGEHLADMFFPEFKSYEADEAFRAFLEECDANVVVEEVTVSEPTTATLGAYFFTPTNIEYALKTYATSGIEPTEEETEIAERLQALQSALSEAQTIGASTVEFTVRAMSRDELLVFADKVNDYIVKENGTDVRKAIMLNGLEFTYEEVNQRYDELVEENQAFMEQEGMTALAAATGEEPPEITTEDDPQIEEEGPALSAYLFSLETSITFYSIERMQNPQAQLDLQDGITG